MSAQVLSKWLADYVMCSNNEAGNSEFKFSQKVFKAIDKAVFTKNSLESMKIASQLSSQNTELLSLESIIKMAIARAPFIDKYR